MKLEINTGDDALGKEGCVVKGDLFESVLMFGLIHLPW